MKIRDRELSIPIIQGGMGVGISLSGLAGAVAACGGMGVISARRILAARRAGPLTFEGLKTLGVVLKRAQYFLTCSGRGAPGTARLRPEDLFFRLADPVPGGAKVLPGQLSLFPPAI